MADRLSAFSSILETDADLGAMTGLGVGGRVEYFARPTSIKQLSELIKTCRAEDLPHRIMGAGCNILVPDEGLKGVVTCLSHDAFKQISVRDGIVTAGAGALLSDVIAQACKASLTGLEGLSAIPATVGGAILRNVGDRGGDIGQLVHAVTYMDLDGNVSTRMRADIRFGYRHSNLDDGLILDASFSLEPDSSDDIVKRVKKVWIAKKAQQPLEFERSGYVFRNPRGLDAVELIEKSGLTGTKVGGAELSDRNPRYVVAKPECTANDVLRLIEVVRNRVDQRTGVMLDLQLDIW